MIEIQPLPSDELRIWKQLRLEALTDAAYAFGDTLEQVKAWTDKEWESSFLDGEGKLFIAKYDGEPVGMARVRRSPKVPSSAVLYSMWVRRTARAKGIGKALMNAALTWAGAAGVDEVVLYVAQGNDAAKRLYLASGFVETGELRPLRSNPAIQMEAMARRMKQPEEQTVSDYYCDSILSGNVPVQVVAETANVLAFHHVFQSWETHIVLIPKKHIRSLVEVEDPQLFAEICQVLVQIINEQHLSDSNYKVITNGGSYQSNQHLHIHLVSGKPLNANNPAQKGELAV